MQHSSKFVSFNHTKCHFTRKLAVFNTILGSNPARWLRRQDSKRPPEFFCVVICAYTLHYWRNISHLLQIIQLIAITGLPVRGKIRENFCSSCIEALACPGAIEGFFSMHRCRSVFFRKGILSLISGKPFGESSGLLEFTSF